MYESDWLAKTDLELNTAINDPNCYAEMERRHGHTVGPWAHFDEIPPA